MPVDDPRLALLLDDYVRDRKDGVTLRSVHNRVTGLQREFERERLGTRERMARIETKVEATEKRDQAEDLADALADANGTGRYRIPQTPVQSFTPAFGTQVPVDLKPERPSGFFASTWKKLKKYLSHALAAFIAAMFTLSISFLSAHGCQAAQTVQAVQTKSDPKVPLPFEPEQPTRPASPSALDAGR